ncbi:MAG: hypothetical protein MMC33_006835 [Icmadophila ericetorum]|nr:hypothetical protein [Icmadophila ericetorum]
MARGGDKVVLNILRTLDQPELEIDSKEVMLRQPAICGHQFDVIAQDRLWHAQLGKESKKITAKEGSVLRIARQLCGYFAILHDLAHSTLRVQMSDESTGKLILLELIYFVVFRITTVHETLARRINDWRNKGKNQGSYHIDLYALEIVYQSTRNRGPLAWSIPDGHALHPLQKMVEALKDRAVYFLSQMERCECALSASCCNGRKLPGNPTLSFVRSRQPLPAILTIGYERVCDISLPWLKHDPLIGDYLPQSILEVLLFEGTMEDVYKSASKGRRFSATDRSSTKASVRMFSVQSKAPFPKIYAQSEYGGKQDLDLEDPIRDDALDSIDQFMKNFAYASNEEPVSFSGYASSSGGILGLNSFDRLTDLTHFSFDPPSYPTALLIQDADQQPTEQYPNLPEQKLEQTKSNSNPCFGVRSLQRSSYTHSSTQTKARAQKHGLTSSISSSGRSSSSPSSSPPPKKRRKKLDRAPSPSNDNSTPPQIENGTWTMLGLNFSWPCEYLGGMLCSRYCKHAREPDALQSSRTSR